MMAVLRIKAEACQRMLTMLWKKERNILEDDDGVEDKGRSLPEDVDYAVEKGTELTRG
jgi:hypothetical protein